MMSQSYQGTPFPAVLSLRNMAGHKSRCNSLLTGGTAVFNKL